MPSKADSFVDPVDAALDKGFSDFGSLFCGLDGVVFGRRSKMASGSRSGQGM
ncbi:hypothetical protein [Thermostichus sp. MS-CIW-39]